MTVDVDKSSSVQSSLPWMVKAMLASMLLIYTLSFFLRSGLSTIADVLEGDFNTTSSGVGLIASSIYVPFTLGQVPIGILLETYQAPVILSISAFILSASVLLFSLSQNLLTAVFARILAGIGIIPTWVAFLAYAGQHCSTKTFTKLIGWSQFLASILVASLSNLQAYLYQKFNIWRPLFYTISILTFIGGVLLGILFVLRQLRLESTVTRTYTQEKNGKSSISNTKDKPILDGNINSNSNGDGINNNNTSINTNIGNPRSASMARLVSSGSFSRLRSISLKRLDVTEIASDIDSDHDGYNYNSSDNYKDRNTNQIAIVATMVKTKNEKEANMNKSLDDEDKSANINEISMGLVFKHVICDGQNILCGIFGFCTASLQLGLNGLWFVSYLIEKYRFKRSDAAAITSISIIMFAVACLFVWPSVAIKYKQWFSYNSNSNSDVNSNSQITLTNKDRNNIGSLDTAATTTASQKTTVRSNTNNKCTNYQKYYMLTGLFGTLFVEGILLIDWNNILPSLNGSNYDKNIIYYYIVFGFFNAIAGCSSGCFPTVFVFVRKRNLTYNSRLGETGVSYVFSIVMLAVFIIQYAIGGLIDVHWNMRQNSQYDENNNKIYVSNDYEFGFITIHVVLIAAMIACNFVKTIE